MAKDGEHFRSIGGGLMGLAWNHKWLVGGVAAAVYLSSGGPLPDFSSSNDEAYKAGTGTDLSVSAPVTTTTEKSISSPRSPQVTKSKKPRHNTLICNPDGTGSEPFEVATFGIINFRFAAGGSTQQLEIYPGDRGGASVHGDRTVKITAVDAHTVSYESKETGAHAAIAVDPHSGNHVATVSCAVPVQRR